MPMGHELNDSPELKIIGTYCANHKNIFVSGNIDFEHSWWRDFYLIKSIRKGWILCVCQLKLAFLFKTNWVTLGFMITDMQ